MSTPIEPEVSKIKPDLSKIGIEVPEASKPADFTYDTSEYDSYVKNGFNPPSEYYRKDLHERRFLSQVDINKGKIKVRVWNISRTKAVDYSNDKEERKEYITFYTEWHAKNFMGEDLWMRDHLEGKHIEEPKRLVMGTSPENGRPTAKYVKGQAITVHNIPFTKANVDKILKSNWFGPDSINITDPDKVMFQGKFDNMVGFPSFDCQGYTYEQFITPEWKSFLELATRPGGPLGKRYAPEKEGNEYYR